MVFGYSSYGQDYSTVMIYYPDGNILKKFRNSSIKNAISINFDSNYNFTIVGLSDPKTVAAKYMNLITNVSSNNIFYPNEYLLHQNFPNPFNPKTIIKYSLLNLEGKASQINLIVYDALGKSILSLVNENKFTGNYKVEFDGSNLPSGIYFYSLYVNTTLIQTKKMIFLK